MFCVRFLPPPSLRLPPTHQIKFKRFLYQIIQTKATALFKLESNTRDVLNHNNAYQNNNGITI